MIVVKMQKVDVGTWGEAYSLIFGNIETNDNNQIKISISEYEADKLKPLFTKETKSGKFNENSEWI